jgi:putative spermidine/putrescine transport system permease protein
MSSSPSLDRFGFALLILLAVVPVGASLAYAALYAVGVAGLLSTGFTLDHVIAALRTRDLLSSLGFSLAVAAASVVLATAVALPLALALRHRLHRGPLRGLLSLPLALPGIVAALLVLQLFSGAGLASRLAFHLGLVSGPGEFPSLVHDPLGAGIVAAHAALAVPFLVLLFAEIGASEKLDALLGLAASLGARPAQGLRRVALPLLLGKAAPSLMLFFVFVLGSYEVPLVLGRQLPQMISLLVLRRYASYDIAVKPEGFLLALAYSGLVLLLVKLAFRAGRRPA